MGVSGITGGGSGAYSPQDIKDEARSALNKIGTNSPEEEGIHYYGSYILDNPVTTTAQAQRLLSFLKDNSTDEQKANNIAGLADEVAKTSGIPIPDSIPTHLPKPNPPMPVGPIPTHLPKPNPPMPVGPIPTHLPKPNPPMPVGPIPTHLPKPNPPMPVGPVIPPGPFPPGTPTKPVIPPNLGPGGTPPNLGPGGTPPNLGPGGTPPDLGPGGTPPNLGPGGTPPKRKG